MNRLVFQPNVGEKTHTGSMLSLNYDGNLVGEIHCDQPDEDTNITYYSYRPVNGLDVARFNYLEDCKAFAIYKEIADHGRIDETIDEAWLIDMNTIAGHKKDLQYIVNERNRIREDKEACVRDYADLMGQRNLWRNLCTMATSAFIGSLLVLVYRYFM